MATHGDALRRRLGLTDSVVIGLGARVGAGIFATYSRGAWPAAARLGGAALLAYPSARLG
ncbi:hypothetical protein [Nocardia vinacea]|uniref:hypothetical protein n=1 Tax=Nocardia vinacea TaxID=96468 RepID=UPI0012F692C3